MPTAMPGEGAKRKRVSTAPKPAKRRRSSGADEGDNETDPSAKILLMEQGILESKKNYNDIGVLLTTAKNGGDESMLATVALCRVFLRLLAQGSLASKKSQSEKDGVVVGWLRDRLSQYKQLLLRLLADQDLAVTALTLCMRILKAVGEHWSDKDEYSFPTPFLEDMVRTILMSDGEDVRRAYIEEFAEQHDDIRYYTFKSMRASLAIESVAKQEETPGVLFDRVFSLLSSLDGVPASADDLDDFYVAAPQKKSHPLRSVAQHKKQAQEAWLALMKLVDTKVQRKRVLDIMTTVIAPWFTKPELLADFLTDCYDAGGSMSLLALSGVFYLIQERNLDYPSFYAKLYSLLDRDMLHSRHRSRFFRLLDTFLASTHLPAALVASFIKRLARLALNAPPSAVAFVTPWIYNLLKRHPSCTFLVHREMRDAETKRRIQDEGFQDAFVADETDPMASGALDSCLWELVQLQSHYHPNIATISKIISEQFTKQSYNMEDFLDHSYASLLEAEMAKEVRKAPVVEFHIPPRVFVAHEAASGTPDSLVVKLWDFGTRA
ncbi:CBF/Mak21 family protein [Hirsutella rhossiliensis]|uniref:CBF/Mak21 family domain-containing protein n=1 Tax=Hirsutella rhossiliensis TaxID=111463 RepID=A0A9P8SJ46_9HYPO|nr:CBF/Mak21 family domain-containing protein [Hirsutella rhossiliensis]KAH0963305.1 CBF/Mak21 family domain-containing protein [Hirsutella rhossiliensis]